MDIQKLEEFRSQARAVKYISPEKFADFLDEFLALNQEVKQLRAELLQLKPFGTKIHDGHPALAHQFDAFEKGNVTQR